MSNINYTILKDFMIFTDIDPKTTYYLNAWSGLGINSPSATTASPYGNVYNPGGVIEYNTLSCTFIIDEDWKVFDIIEGMAIANAPTSSEGYNLTTTNISLYVFNNTYKKPIGHIEMPGAYVESIMNVDQSYNTEDNTVVHTLTALFRYQYHKFVRETDELL